jgi:hypothetical protein
MIPKRGQRSLDQIMRQKKGPRTMPGIMRQIEEG